MTINLSVAPYYDDFDTNSGYHKILFIPGRPIQARELTQMQSILQNQIKRHSDFIFKNGSMVIPGFATLINNITYIKLQDNYGGFAVNNYLDNFIGTTIIGLTSNVKATVIHAEKSTDIDPPVLFISYTSGGIDSTDPTIYYSDFIQNETLKIESGIKSVNIIDSTDFTGKGSIASIVEGVYYINGYFVQNTAQTIVLDKFSTTPTYKVGLSVIESVVTAVEDNSLYDNSNGFINEKAIGADRLKISLTLAKDNYFGDYDDLSFIPLIFIKDGIVQERVTKTKLNEVEKILANRTYSESGDYIVEPFKQRILEYRSNNRGLWEAKTPYVKGDIINYTIGNNIYYLMALNSGFSNITAPTITYGEFVDGDIKWLAIEKPFYNTGSNKSTSTELTDHIAESNLLITKLSNGKAYIKGFEVDLSEGFKTVAFNKTLVTTDYKLESITVNHGQYFIVYNLKGLPILSNIDASNRALSVYNIKDNNDSIVGTCRIRNFEHQSGTIGSAGCFYKVFVFDVKMNIGKVFAKDAQKIISSDSYFSATISGTRTLLSGSVSTTASDTTIAGDGTLFTVELSSGDSIVIENEKYKVNVLTDAVTMSILPSSGAVATLTNVPIYKEISALYGEDNLIQELPYNMVHSLQQNKTVYFIKRMYQAQASGGVITINLSATNESFAVSVANLHIISRVDTSAAPIAATISVEGLYNSQLKITGLSGNTTYRILTTIRKVKESAKEKQKIRKYKTIELTTLNSVDLPSIQLTEADCTRLISIKQSSGDSFDYSNRSESKEYNSLNESDITLYYKLNTNAYNSYYGISEIIPQSGFIPSAPIRITYEYYDHGTGDYFSVNSYDIPREFIPIHKDFSLGDCLDFRPRIADTGISFETADGASVTEPLSSDYPIELYYAYYLPRRDILQLDPSGNFRIEEGISSDNPIAPLPNDNNIIISYYDIPAYITNVKAIINEEVPIKRYTMKDVGAIDTRLINAETTASLTGFDELTASEQIKDENGLNRYKSGFFTDQFKSHRGNLSNPDYKCAIDISKNECRPQYHIENVKLIEKDKTKRKLNGYQITGDIVTLPYTNEILIQNVSATQPEYITPFTHIRTLVGNLNIFPTYDTWFDSITTPDIINKSEGSFASIVSAANDLGVLGTVWNAWQETERTTVATNTSISNSSSLSAVSSAAAISGNELSATRTVTTRTDTSVTTVNGTDAVTYDRDGVNTYIQEEWNELGRISGVQDHNWIPYMRQKAIVLYGKKFMPNVQMYAYIGHKEVTDYITPSTNIVISGKIGSFLDYKNSSLDQTDLTARQYGTNDYDLLDHGEVVYGLTSGATAIIITEHSSTSIKVLNVKGTFSTSETIVGKTSGAKATYVSLSQDSFVTNSDGSIYAVLMIPNNEQIKIPTQITSINLRDALITEEETTRGAAIYDSHGLANQKSTTILSVRQANILSRTVDDTKVETENWTTSSSTSSTSVVSDITTAVNCNCDCVCGGCGGSGGDPLAQSFKHTDKGGIFLTKIDLYFHTVDQAESSPIFLQLREMVNGYPGPGIVPFSMITKKPSEITQYSTTSLKPTSFVFDSPVYLLNDVEYCLIVGSDHSNTKIWTSKMGDVMLNGMVLMAQPLFGSLFKSQNASTWNAEQLSDICFTAYSAKFDITKTGILTLYNSPHSTAKMSIDPFKVISGETTVRVLHYNHGLKNGDKVTFSGVTTFSALNAQYTVANATFDAFTITTSAAATTGWIGGSDALITYNKKMDALYLTGEDLVLPETHVNYTIKTTNYNRVKSTAEYPLQIKQNIFMDDPKYILSTENETLYGATKSLEVSAYMYSDNEKLSPIIDLNTYSLHAISNRVNLPTETTYNLAIDKNELYGAMTGLVFDSVGTIATTDSNYFGAFDSVKVGQYIEFAGTGANNNKLLVTALEKTTGPDTRIIYTSSTVTSETSVASSLSIYDFFTDSIAPEETSNLANYIIPIIKLENPASGFRLIFDYNKMKDADIRIYYKTNTNSSGKEIETINWIELTNIELKQSSYTESFTEKKQDFDIEDYNEITLKVEMSTINTSKPPKIKNFRLIALA